MGIRSPRMRIIAVFAVDAQLIRDSIMIYSGWGGVARKRPSRGGERSSSPVLRRCRKWAWPVALSVGEDVVVRPAFVIEACPMLNEGEAGLREISTPFPHQHLVQPLAQPVQPQHVVGCIL